jgi:hypothetical protein
MEREREEDKEMETGEDEEKGPHYPSNIWTTRIRRRQFHWPANMDLEARKAYYVRALMSAMCAALNLIIAHCAH